MPPPGPPLHLSASHLAQHFRFRCERRLRWEMAAPGEGVPAPLPRMGMQLLAAAGDAFERRKIAALVRRFGEAAVLRPRPGERGLAPERVLAVLRDPGEVRFLVQPRLQLADPGAFAARHGLDPALLSFGPAFPDLVRLGRWSDGVPRLAVIDVKWSRERALHHFAQIAFYTLLLEEMVAASGIPARVDTRTGWIWNRGAPTPRPFALGAYRHHLSRLLGEELPRLVQTAPEDADWHLLARCAGCGWFEHCRSQAEATDHLSRVPGLTPVARRLLNGRGIHTVAALNQAAIKPGTYRGCHALESGEPVLRRRAMALTYQRRVEQEKQSWLLGEREQLRLIVSAEGDPVSGTVYALGLRAEKAGVKARETVLLSTSASPRGEAELLRGFLAQLQAAARALLPAPGPPPQGAAVKPVHLFVWDRAELELLRGLLVRHLTDPAAQPGLAAVAALVFPDAQGFRAAPAAPGTVLLDAVCELFALPIPFALDLASVSAALAPSEGAVVWDPPAGYRWPLSSQVAFERIHQLWRGGEPGEGGEDGPLRAALEGVLHAKLGAIGSVLRGVRELAGRSASSRLRLDPGPPLEPAEADPIPDPTLEALRVFTELEAAAESLAVRALHALPARDRARRFEAITGMEPVQRVSGNEWSFEFDPECREAKFRPGDFALVLTNDNGEMLAEVDRRPWLRRKLMVELAAYDLAGERPRVTLVSEYGFARLEQEGVLKFDRQCVLDRADTDFNTHRVVATLRALAVGGGESAFVRGVLAGAPPPEWSLTALDAEAGWAGSVARAGGVVLNPEQTAAWRAPFTQPVTVVWGPPGTGKTYLLAWTLLGLCAAARVQGRALRILVTASTHRAIANVLMRVVAEGARAGGAQPRVVKLEGRGSEADREAQAAGVETVADERLEAILQECDASATPLLAGGTVWSLWKRMRAAAAADEEAESAVLASLFDVVVVDEASQMKVPEALIALSSIRAGGRVLLAGDDRQLAPIVRGSYEPEETLFGSAFAHLAAHFGRLTLNESRRMNEGLVAYPRRTFYPGLVTAVPSRALERRADLAAACDDERLLLDAFLPADGAVVLCTYRGYAATARNAFEAWLAARISGLARRWTLDPATGAPWSAEAFRERGLALISPHRAQNGAILHELAAQGWLPGELPVVDTVERMQGNEREMIVVSYAVADQEYAEREAGFLLDPNRFNVAITRARSRLVVLMSDEVLRALPLDERVATESMAVKGYLRQSWHELRSLELAAPDGTPVQLTLHLRPVT